MDKQILEKAKTAQAARDQAASGLVKMEEKKASVKPTVYQKVRAEYETKLEEAKKELSALLAQVQARAQELTRSAQELTKSLDSVSEARDELTLRHHIGEIDDAEYRSRIEEFDRRGQAADKEVKASQAELEEITAPFMNEPGFRAGVAAATKSGQFPAPVAPAPPAAKSPPSPPRQEIEDALGDPFAESATSSGAVKASFTNPILLVNSRGEETSYLLDLGELAIGRAHDNDIVIEEDGALPKHAVVRFEQDHYVVTTVGSDSNISVNDKAVRRSALADGDRIRIGKSEITFRNVRFDDI